MLQCGDERECRLGSLIEIRARRLQSVVSTAGLGVPHHRSGVVAARKPLDREVDAATPLVITGHRSGAGAGIGDRRDLDRLLVERRGVIVWPGAADRSRREMTVEGFAIKQPTQQAEPVLDDLGSAEEVTGGDQCFGQHGIGVRAARFRPQPTVVGW